MKKQVGLIINCKVCKDLITEPGAILWSPPDLGNWCLKHHICRKCYFILYDMLNFEK